MVNSLSYDLANQSRETLLLHESRVSAGVKEIIYILTYHTNDNSGWDL